MTLNEPDNDGCYIDTWVTSHNYENEGILQTSHSSHNICSVIVGNGSSINVHKTSSSVLYNIDPHRTLHLHNVLMTPDIIIFFVYVHKFTRDNHCSIEFDVFGFSVKDFKTKQVLLYTNSSGDLYPITTPSP